MAAGRDDITGLLKRFQDREPGAQAELVQAVYQELRILARRFMARERRGHTVQATALVHEAYVRLSRMENVNWRNRAHFFATAATVMRHFLVDHARKHMAGGLGGKQNLLSLDEDLQIPQSPERWLQLLDVHNALEKLSSLDERAARVVELRYFGGMSMEETAEALGLTERTVQRDWTFGRAWLRGELAQE